MNIFLLISLAVFLVSLLLQAYLKRKKKNLIIAGGCLATFITIILVLSGICTILNFIFKYLL